jgi:hypothetical protein
MIESLEFSFPLVFGSAVSRSSATPLTLDVSGLTNCLVPPSPLYQPLYNAITQHLKNSKPKPRNRPSSYSWRLPCPQSGNWTSTLALFSPSSADSGWPVRRVEAIGSRSYTSCIRSTVGPSGIKGFCGIEPTSLTSLNHPVTLPALSAHRLRPQTR